MTESDDLVLRRKEILELSGRLGNVSEACRRFGIPRSSYYQYRKRYRESGLAGLRNRPSVHKTHPMATPRAVEQDLVELSFAHPSWGCVRLAGQLRDSGVLISSPTVQKILSRRGLATAQDRWLRLEAWAMQSAAACTEEQLAWIDAWNPAFRERGRESTRPGETLLQDVRVAPRAARVYVHLVVDSFGGVAFASLHACRDTADAVKLLEKQVLPFYESHGQPIESLITPDVPLFWGSPRHPFEAAGAEARIDHRAAHPAAARQNGFVERFRQDLHVEFVAPRRTDWTAAPMARWKSGFAAWLKAYNETRPYGYRNQGRSSLDFVHECT